MANFVGKLQQLTQAHAVVTARLNQAQIASGNFADRSTIESDRQIVRDYLASAAKMRDQIEHAADLMRAELDATHTPVSKREATVAGFMEQQALTRPIRLRLMHDAESLGETIQAVLDLFEKNWGKWRRDDTGRLIFQDAGTLAEYNNLIQQIRDATVDQHKAQEEMLSKLKAPVTQ